LLPRNRELSLLGRSDADCPTLLLYLDDAIAAVPFGPVVTGFYRNNGSGAKVAVEPMPGPKPPPSQPYDFSQNR
jgi:hypothetical protein